MSSFVRFSMTSSANEKILVISQADIWNIIKNFYYTTCSKVVRLDNI